jgi:hypothetical protein
MCQIAIEQEGLALDYYGDHGTFAYYYTSDAHGILPEAERIEAHEAHRVWHRIEDRGGVRRGFISD